MDLSKKTFWISLSIHGLVLFLLGSCVVQRAQEEKATAFTAEVQAPVLIDEPMVEPKEEMPEEDAGGGSDSQLPMTVSNLPTTMPEILTVDTSKNFVVTTPLIGPLPVMGREGNGSGNGSGGRNGDGTGTGDLGGMRVPLETVVVMDSSGSMLEYNRAIYFQYKKVFPATPLVTIPTSRTLQIDEGIHYAVEQLKATSVYVLSDFQDVYQDSNREAAMSPVVIFLKQRGVKLFLCSVDKPPPRVLEEYAQATGASKKFGTGLR